MLISISQVLGDRINVACQGLQKGRKSEQCINLALGHYGRPASYMRSLSRVTRRKFFERQHQERKNAFELVPHRYRTWLKY